MARSSTSSSQPKSESSNGAACSVCGTHIKRSTDLPRHMLIHAKNKDEFMFVCPVEGCTHQTLQRSNLATHIRTHTRAKPHKCPEYFPNGQKCQFATSDPSSLHRHRKRKHGYKPRSSTTTTNATASGSGTREDSVESFESEESFGLRPETSNSDPAAANDTEHTSDPSGNTLSYPFYHYSTCEKVPIERYDSPYYPPQDFKLPSWIDSPFDSPTPLSTFSCTQEDWDAYTLASAQFTSGSEAPLSPFEASWYQMMSQDSSWNSDETVSPEISPMSSPASSEYSLPSPASSSYPDSQLLEDLVAFYPAAFTAGQRDDSFTYLPPLYLSPSQSAATAPQWSELPVF